MAIQTYKKGMGTKLSKNFMVYEFRCGIGRPCSCTTTLIDDKLVEILQKIRDHFGASVTITSGHRCASYNKSVDGATGSYHTKGMAADIVVDGHKPAEVAKYAESIGVLGIGLYETDKDGHFVHVDTRTVKSFWYGQAQAKRATFGGAPAASTTPAQAPKETCTVKLPVLSKGDEGESVRSLQRLLVGHSYSVGNSGADRKFGSATENALKRFQKDHKLTENGKSDAETWAALLGADS